MDSIPRQIVMSVSTIKEDTNKEPRKRQEKKEGRQRKREEEKRVQNNECAGDKPNQN
jgi:hypothetical protein